MKTFSILCLLITRAIAGDFVYMDASTGNTTLSGAPIILGENVLNGVSGTTGDGVWSLRTLDGFEGNNYFESDGGSTSGDAESTPDLITTLTLPTAGTYELVIVFAKNNNRDIAAKSGSSPTATDIFTDANSLNANQATASPAIVFAAGYANGRGASHGAGKLGQVTTTAANQDVRIFVNGFSSTTTQTDQRTQYDGIGYRLTTPPVPVHRDVFILAGQSNADGRGNAADLTGDLSVYSDSLPGVIINYTNPDYTSSDRSLYQKWVTLRPGFSGSGSTPLPHGTFGPEIGMGHVLAQHFAHPAIVKVAEGGTALTRRGSDWYPADLNSPDVGRLYTALISSTRKALQDLTDAGDTYTVHTLFWHQGESDSGESNRTGYAARFAEFVKRVRVDLGLPDLRFIVGQVAANRSPEFADIQWGNTRSLRNISFAGTENLTTSDPQTHFDAPSAITLGRRMAETSLRDFDTIDFEFPLFTTAAVDRQFDFSSTPDSLARIFPTVSQGEYVGGQAVGKISSVPSVNFFNLRETLPLLGLSGMRADFFAGDSGYDANAAPDSSLQVHAWKMDANSDGNFSPAEAAIGMGLSPDGKFSIYSGGVIVASTSFGYTIDHWYRVSLKWSAQDTAGKRNVSLLVRDLQTGNSLPEISVDLSSTQFGGEPLSWYGTGFQADRGLIDNVSALPPGFAALSRTFPGLTGGRDGDSDSDGFTNLLEYISGTNPVDPQSRPSLLQPVLSETTASVSLTPLTRLPDVSRTIEWSLDLENWSILVGAPVGGDIQFSTPRDIRGFFREYFSAAP